jgi:DNA-binding PadR family transcriptional regulator
MDISSAIKPAAFHILLALARKDGHGYAVMQAVRDQSNGRVRIQTGSFYRHLSRLIDDGLVMETPGPKSGDDPRRGVYYRLTPGGRRTLVAEKARLTDLVAQLNKVRLSSRRSDA